MVFVLTNSDSTMAPPNKNPGLDGGITKRPCGRFCRCQSLVVISWRCQPQDFVETKLPFLMGKSYETTDIICARRNSLFLLKLRCFCFLFGKRMLIYIYTHILDCFTCFIVWYKQFQQEKNIVQSLSDTIFYDSAGWFLVNKIYASWWC